ncbi:MAG: glycosyltransferase [Planctomycetes bacterium]|nr:glycosyltransferase [Planctomycetota bacterium]
MRSVKLSILIPAYNEEKLIGRCVASVFAALRAVGDMAADTEVIVADNNSTDATADLARSAGARVVHEPIQQIARARNAGAASAGGDWFLFIDGDSVLHADSLTDMLEHIETGRYVGGGCVLGYDEAPPVGHFAAWLWNVIGRTFTLAAGSFLFCRSDAFREVGGFDETLYAAEELALSKALKRWGKSASGGRRLKFIILRKQPHISSGRKFYLYSKREIAALLLRTLFRPRRTVRSRKHLDLFYDGRR